MFAPVSPWDIRRRAINPGDLCFFRRIKARGGETGFPDIGYSVAIDIFLSHLDFLFSRYIVFVVNICNLIVSTLQRLVERFDYKMNKRERHRTTATLRCSYRLQLMLAILSSSEISQH